jgi:3-deoxy-D-manno-octulosonate cytidylyltransferase
MSSIKILDCTLRDGGYINNWEFEDRISIDIIEAIQNSGIEIVECGYLNIKDSKNINSTIFESITDVNRIFPKQKNFTEIVVMINYGDYDVNLLPYRKETIVGGIRLAFHKKDIDKALEDCKVIKKKGYKLFVQPMLTSTYSEKELYFLIKETNIINPYAFYIVDSFGSMEKEELLSLLKLTDIFLDKHIVVGFHSHNNMQMAFSNSIEFLSNVGNRDAVVDSSIFGMGRGAGNLNSEIIADFINKHYNHNYKLEPLLDVIDNFLEKMHQDKYWGFSVAHFLSGKSKIHPNYATHLLNKKTSTVSTINNILNSIEDSKKNKFDKDYIEKKYIDLLSKNKSNQNISFKNLDRPILIVASGNSIHKEFEKVKEFILRKNPLIISVNHLNDEIESDYIFFSNQKRLSEFEKKLSNQELIITSNLTSKYSKVKVIDFNSLYSFKDVRSDNASVLLLNLLAIKGISKVYVAGLDGYDLNIVENYSYKEYSVVADRKILENINLDISNSLEIVAKFIDIDFITSSIFKKDKKLTVLGVIPARYKSSRFEGKPLCMINGTAMIERTYNQANKSKLLDNLVVATDDNRIIEFCESKNIPVVLTSEKCLTGTDRIAEVSKNENYNLYLNIQGDEPVIDPENIDLIINEFTKYGDEYIAYNLYKEIDNIIDEVSSPTIIKTIVNENDELIYMSRLPIPFNKSDNKQSFNKQVCVYGFTKKALRIFSERDKTLNEKFEDIEILRFIDMGYKVKMIKTEYDSIAVDVPSDIKKVEDFLNGQNS